jgi:alpha-L-rhamnosidase
MVNQRTFPGWGYMLEKGATTLWEHWDFSDNAYSHNHPMFGSVSEWFFKCLGGISPADDAVGFDKVIIRPQPAGDLKWAKASYDSVRGQFRSEWHRNADGFELRVRIPVGVMAAVIVPAQNQTDLSEGGRPLETAPGVKMRTIADGKALLEVGSGDYLFRSR